MHSDINIVGIKNHLKPNILKAYIEVLETVNSTNDYLKNGLIKNGTLVVAKRQTNGKGRLGKTFLSDDGGIYMSLKIGFYDKSLLNLITPAVAVAVSKTLERLCNIDTKIKWVNDIYALNKKLCGILTETIFDNNEGLSSVIIGIGINVDNNIQNDEIKNIATSLFEITKQNHDKSKIIAEIANEIFEQLKNLKDKTFLEYYKQKSLLLGKDITVIENENSYTAKALDIDDECRLVIEKDGEIKKLFFGEVSTKL